MFMLRKNKKSAFTIVELLVVIVIIGILAAVAIVSYTGVSQKAISASLQSDLASAAKQIELFKVDNGDYYPTTIDCMQPNSSTNKCIKSSSGSSYIYTVDNVSSPRSYSLYVNNGTTYYYVTSTTAPQKLLATPGTWKQVSVGNDHTCAIAWNDRAYCWGGNGYGQLGNNTKTNSLIPVAVDTSSVLAGKTIKSIAAGNLHTCAIASDNNAYCWGSNSYGELGNGGTTQSSVPVAVDRAGAFSGKTILSIATSYYFSCAVASDNKAYCWGYGLNGQMGNSISSSSLTPTQVLTGSLTITSISLGGTFGCARSSLGGVMCWGTNNRGQLGNNTTTGSATPVSVNNGELYGNTIKSISAGWEFVCAIGSDDKAYCWGDNQYGQNGSNSPGTGLFMTPKAVNTNSGLLSKTIKYITAGYWHACVVASDDNAFCWGDHTYGENGGYSLKYAPAALILSGTPMLGKTVKYLSDSTYYHTCVIASDDKIYCWGYDYNGQLGDNLTANSPAFVTANQAP